MKTKHATETKTTHEVKLAADELLVKNAAYETMYSNTERARTVLWVLRKDAKPGQHIIAFWATYLNKWLELRVSDSYKLSTDTKNTIANIRSKLTDRLAVKPKKLDKKLRRKWAHADMRCRLCF